MTLAELLASKKQGTERFPSWSLADLLARRDEPLDAKFNPSGVGPGVSYGSLASILADFTPGIGDVKSGIDAVREAASGNYGMSLADAFGALPLIGGMGAIKAYHGSPHKFDAFDMSKIGTGEGAQAYGHGLYFAESPEVAKAYKSVLAEEPIYIHRETGRRISKSDPDWESIRDRQMRMERNGYGAQFDEQFDVDQGALYETSLEWPDPAREAADPLGPQHFLDWDKPLSEQPEILSALQKSRSKHVKAVLESLGDLNEPVTSYGEVLGAKTGADLLGRLSYNMEGRPTGRKASEAIGKTGIPGIRYLDQGSRGAGNGTYNYVVFDDKMPRIISRNGMTLADLLKR